MQVTFEPETHTYRDSTGQVVPSVTQILKGAGLLDYSMYSGAEYAAARGTAVHLACQYWDEGDLDYDGLDPEIVPYVDAWIRYREDSDFVPCQLEQMVWCASPRYAGTLDRVGMVQGHQWLLDIKTGQPHPATALQTAAYAEASGLLGLTKRGAVYLRNDGTYKLEVHNNHLKDWQNFAAVCAVYTWKQKHNIGGINQ